MSVEAQSWAIGQSGMGIGAKCCLVMLANHANRAGICWPGRKLLAQECDCRPETISKHMAVLEERGLISRAERRRRNGSKTSDWIVLAPLAQDRGPMIDADPSELPQAISDLARKRSGEEFAPDDFRPGQVSFPGRPEPSVEPSAPSGSVSAREKTWSYDGKRVQSDTAAVALEAFDAYVAKTGQRIKPMRPSNGAPSDALRLITGAVLDHPDVDASQWARLIDGSLAAPWWQGAPTAGVIFGPGVVDRQLQALSDGSLGRPNASNVHPIRSATGTGSGKFAALMNGLDAANPRLQAQAAQAQQNALLPQRT